MSMFALSYYIGPLRGKHGMRHDPEGPVQNCRTKRSLALFYP